MTILRFFQNGGRPLSCIFKKLIFKLQVWLRKSVCVIMQNVVAIGQTVA